MRRILSLGGGGIKGARTAAYLSELEEASGRKIADCFDLITGTSTGGMLAIALAMGVAASELVTFYEKEGSKIFPADLSSNGLLNGLRHIFHGKYSPTPLQEAIENCVGKNRRLGESKTRLIIPSVQPDTASMYLFKTRHHELFRKDHKLRAADVAMATSAAPSYFPPHQIKGVGSFIDGGLWANNPVGLAVTEAVSYLNWDPKEIHVLSIECPQEPCVIPGNDGLSWLFGPSVLSRLMALQSSSAKGTALALMRDIGNLPKLARFTSVMDDKFPKNYFRLDNAQQINALLAVGHKHGRDDSKHLMETFFASSKEDFIPIP